MTLPPHPNIIAFYDFFLQTSKVHFVFACMEGVLFQIEVVLSPADLFFNRWHLAYFIGT